MSRWYILPNSQATMQVTMGIYSASGIRNIGVRNIPINNKLTNVDSE